MRWLWMVVPAYAKLGVYPEQSCPDSWAKIGGYDVAYEHRCEERCNGTSMRLNLGGLVARVVTLCSALLVAACSAANSAQFASIEADPVFVGAGDITNCAMTEDESTAQLLDAIDGTVFTLGDNAYPDGTAEQFDDCYDLTWGRHKARTMPVPGNHDYHTAHGSGYYAYFGARAHGPNGYSSYELGKWHIIALNTEIDVSANSAQVTWLKADLAAHNNVCTLAYWHEPRWSSGSVHGSSTRSAAIWRALYASGVDVVLNGHDHVYERFAPQNPRGQADPEGIREFVVGTGGAALYDFGTPLPNSEIRNNTAHGVLKLTLHATSYEWEFVPIAGQTFHDSGSANCVDSHSS
jgi:acid phosphatase type 7